jgi:hypothetical protein
VTVAATWHYLAPAVNGWLVDRMLMLDSWLSDDAERAARIGMYQHDRLL